MWRPDVALSMQSSRVLLPMPSGISASRPSRHPRRSRQPRVSTPPATRRGGGSGAAPSAFSTYYVPASCISAVQRAASLVAQQTMRCVALRPGQRVSTRRVPDGGLPGTLTLPPESLATVSDCCCPGSTARQRPLRQP
jgi:hypothetical protein